MRFLLAIIIAAGASGCATVPYQQASQGPDWVEVVNIRQQELAKARATVNESCKRSSYLSNLVAEKLAKLTANLFSTTPTPHAMAIGSAKQTIALADQAYAECLRADEVRKEEEARYEQLGRMLELAFPPSIDVDVYHHYY
jgi:hypothetical protein